jgi:hypothetical protein
MALREIHLFVLLHRAARHPLGQPLNLIALCA